MASGGLDGDVLRALLETPRDDFRIVAINDLAPAETSAASFSNLDPNARASWHAGQSR